MRVNSSGIHHLRATKASCRDVPRQMTPCLRASRWKRVRGKRRESHGRQCIVSAQASGVRVAFDRHVAVGADEIVRKLGEAGQNLESIRVGTSLVVELGFRKGFREDPSEVRSLLCAARYCLMNGRMVSVSNALNERDYLAQTFIKVDHRSFEPLPEGHECVRTHPEDPDTELYSKCAIYFKGFDTETRKGKLLLEKLDYFQSVSFAKAFPFLMRLLPKILRQPVVSEEVLADLQDERETELQKGRERRIEAVSSQDAFHASEFLEEAELVDPKLSRLFLLFNDTHTGVQFHMFRDVPWAGLRLLFPARRLSFQPLELLRLDLLTGFPVAALAYRWNSFVDPTMDSMDAFLQDSYLNLLAAGAVTSLFGRILLSWRRVLFTYDQKLTLLINEKRTTSKALAFEHLEKEAAEERSKEILCIYAILLSAGKDGLKAAQVKSRVQDWLRESFALDVVFDEDGKAIEHVLALGLAEQLEKERMRAVEPTIVQERLRNCWLAAFDNQTHN